MAFHHSVEKPKRVVLELERLEDPDRELFRDYAKLCVLKQVRKEQAYADLVRAEVLANHDLLSGNWVDWTELEKIFKANGFTINRTTFWNYREKGLFPDAEKSDGVTTLFEADQIIEVFKNNGIS